MSATTPVPAESKGYGHANDVIPLCARCPRYEPRYAKVVIDGDYLCREHGMAAILLPEQPPIPATGQEVSR